MTVTSRHGFRQGCCAAISLTDTHCKSSLSPSKAPRTNVARVAIESSAGIHIPTSAAMFKDKTEAVADQATHAA